MGLWCQSVGAERLAVQCLDTFHGPGSLVPTPDNGHGRELRVQNSEGDEAAPQGNAGGQQAIAATADDVVQIGFTQCLGHQPIRDAVDEHRAGAGIRFLLGHENVSRRLNHQDSSRRWARSGSPQ